MQCTICGGDAWYVCGRSGRPVCPQHSRIEVVSRLSFGSSDGLHVREATPSDYQRIGEVAEYFWGETDVVCFDKQYNILKLPAYVVSAYHHNHLTGLLSYSLEPDSLVIVMLDVLPGYQGLGAGKMLVDAAKKKAESEGKEHIVVATSNDDVPAMYFYQRNGFQLYEVKPDLVTEHHGEVQVGFGGIPVRDELRLRCPV